MTDLLHEKIVNPDLARGPLRSAEPHGEFKAYIRVAEPENVPDYVQHIEIQGPGLFKVRIPCTKMALASEDDNVVSIELIEHISSCSYRA